MARRSDHTREELRDLLLDAALELIEAEGVEGLSTRKVAKLAGYTSGTIYQHFKDVGELVLSVNARTMRGLIDAMAAAEVDLPSDPDRRIHAYADIYVDYVQAHRHAWDAMFARRRAPDETVPEWYAMQIGDLVDLVANCFKGIPAGAGAGACTPHEAARLVWASVHSVCALDSGGRLDLIMRTPLKPLVHRLVDIHIAAYSGDARGA